MSEQNEATKKEENVATPPVEAPKTEEDTPKTEVDYQALADQAVAIADEATKQLEKERKDKENYKAGMLLREKKLKSLKEQGVRIDDEENLTREDIDKLIEEKLSAVKVEKEAEVQDLSKKVSELKTALINRQGLPDKPTGNSSESPASKPKRWVDAPEVKADLLSRGLDPNKVYENWKANQDK